MGQTGVNWERGRELREDGGKSTSCSSILLKVGRSRSGVNSIERLLPPPRKLTNSPGKASARGREARLFGNTSLDKEDDNSETIIRKHDIPPPRP